MDETDIEGIGPNADLDLLDPFTSDEGADSGNEDSFPDPRNYGDDLIRDFEDPLLDEGDRPYEGNLPPDKTPGDITGKDILKTSTEILKDVLATVRESIKAKEQPAPKPRRPTPTVKEPSEDFSIDDIPVEVPTGGKPRQPTAPAPETSASGTSQDDVLRKIRAAIAGQKGKA